MIVNKKQVFLIQGQYANTVNGVAQISPEISQLVVVADNEQIISSIIAKHDRNFKLLGYASLQDYEDAVYKLRATLKGNDVGLQMLVDPVLAGDSVVVDS